MSYTKATDFLAKDSLLPGNPLKIVKGSEIDTEFEAIETADALNVKTTALGTNVATALGVNVGTAGAFVVNGGVLGTPSSGTLTNCTIPQAGVTGLTTADSPQFTAVNIGHASDTTVTRVSAGVIAVEGSNVVLASGIGVSVQAYDADTTKNDVANTFTAQQSFTGPTAAAPAIAGASDPNTGVFFPAADTVAVSTAGVERMRIDSSGNVGIGAAPNSSWGSSYKGIDINGLGNIQSNGTSFTCVGTNIYNNGSEWRAKTTGSGALLLSGANGYGAHSFYSFDSTTADTAVTLKALGGFTSAGVWLWSQPVASGYGTGAGGTVTQATSRVTGVTLSKPTGAITLFTAAGSATATTFTVTNTVVASTDTVVLSVKSGTNVYLTAVTAVANGSFNITFWTTGGTASDAPVINFAILKGATS